jgi:prepilin-type N-terminal cleavage/methylation domain-containing protein
VVTSRNNSSGRPAFTLIELLAVVAIIGLLSVATVASYQAIANDVRQAGAVEEVKAMLARTRQKAISDSRATALVFRPVVVSPGVQQLEGVIAQFAGEVQPWIPDSLVDTVGDTTQPRCARFEPIDAGDPMRLAVGVGVGIPAHRISNTSDWGLPTVDPMAFDGDVQYLTASAFAPLLPEVPGQMLGILFGADGSIANRIHGADAEWFWVDFNGDGAQRYAGIDYCNRPDAVGFGPPESCPPGVDAELWSPPSVGCYVGARYRLSDGVHLETKDMWEDNEAERLPICHENLDDEPLVVTGPWLVVYDDRDARAELDPLEWSDSATAPTRRKAVSSKAAALRTFIDANGRQLHFSRFSGVPLHGSDR